MFEEFVPLVSTVLSLTSLLYQAQHTRSQSRKAQAEKLNADLEEELHEMEALKTSLIQTTNQML